MKFIDREEEMGRLDRVAAGSDAALVVVWYATSLQEQPFNGIQRQDVDVSECAKVLKRNSDPL